MDVADYQREAPSYPGCVLEPTVPPPHGSNCAWPGTDSVISYLISVFRTISTMDDINDVCVGFTQEKACFCKLLLYKLPSPFLKAWIRSLRKPSIGKFCHLMMSVNDQLWRELLEERLVQICFLPCMHVWLLVSFDQTVDTSSYGFPHSTLEL